MMQDLGFEGRMQLVADMFALRRALVRAEVIVQEPGLSEVEVEKRVFLRFYEHELAAGLIERALRGIEAKHAEAAPAG